MIDAAAPLSWPSMIPLQLCHAILPPGAVDPSNSVGLLQLVVRLVKFMVSLNCRFCAEICPSALRGENFQG